MKILLIDRPVDRRLVLEDDVEFFGPWAQPIDSPEDLSRQNFEPYPSPETVCKTSVKAVSAAEDIVATMSKIMPPLTGVNMGPRFWRLYLGHYVIRLTGIVEDIETRRMALPDDDYIIGVPESNYIDERIPKSWQDADDMLIGDDHFRWHAMVLYLKNYYSEFQSVNYEKTPLEKLTTTFEDYSIKILNKGRLFLGALTSVGTKITEKSPSLIWETHHTEGPGLKRVKADFLQFVSIKSFNGIRVDKKKREELSANLPHPYGELVRRSLPLIALEGLPHLIRSLKEKTGLNNFNSVKRVYTHGQAFTNEASKRAFLSILADEGKEIISIQHGGGATYLAHSVMFLERKIADKYICWGPGYYDAADGQDSHSIQHLPSIYLSNLKEKKKSAASGNKKKRWDTLFVILEENRHIKWIYNPLFPDLAYNYFRREKTLFDYFCVDTKSAIKVYSIGYGWGQYDWIKEKYPKVTLLKSGRFVDYARHAELVIIDYNSTGFLEMLAIGKPILATWNRRWFTGNKRFEEYIDRLKDVNVFFEEPDALIEEYENVISTDVNKWWNEKKRQDVVTEMAQNFALTADNVYEEWNREFERL